MTMKNEQLMRGLTVFTIVIAALLGTFGICFAETDPFAENDAQAEDILAQTIPQIWMYPKTKTWDDDDPLDTRIRYVGEPVELAYELVAPDGDANAAYILFADGIVQPYRLADPADEAEGIDAPVHFFRLKKNETREITILFDPVVGKKGDTVGLYFAVVIGPLYVPPDKEHPGYGHFSELATSNPTRLIMEADSRGESAEDALAAAYRIPAVTQPIPENQWRPGGTIYERPEEILRMWTNYLRPIGEPQVPIAYIEAENGTVQFQLLRTGGTSFSYRTTVFVNHEPIAVDGHPDFVFDAEYGMETSVPITLDVSSYPRRNTLYTVTVPVGDLTRIRMGEASFMQSERLLLINDLAEE